MKKINQSTLVSQSNNKKRNFRHLILMKDMTYAVWTDTQQHYHISSGQNLNSSTLLPHTGLQQLLLEK